MLRFIVLGSGSAGNSTVVCAGGSRVLVDAGLSASQLLARLQAAEVDPASLDAVLLTHEHGDHTRGLDVFLRKHPLPVFSTAMTREVLRESLRSSPQWRILPGAGAFCIGALEMDVFGVPHDAVEPVGFVFRHGGASLGLVTDAGHITPLMRTRLRDLDAIFLEANYCADMLANDTKRPWSTKQRIAGRHGHLSNTQAAELIQEITSPRLQRIVLGHLSRDCNTPHAARTAILGALEKAAHGTPELHCALQDEPAGWFEVSPAAPLSVSVPPPASAPSTAAGSPSPSEPAPLPGVSAAWSQLELF